MRKSDFTLPTLDDLFSTQAERDDAKLERVRNIPLAELHPFKGHPFKVQNNEEMQRMIESIRKVGAITPALARPLPDGGYELISGHRRLAACQVLGVETMPVIVRELSDDEAVIAMVDANLQRETILPSEKAFAYKMKRDALNHQGMTSPQVGEKLLTAEKNGLDGGDSRNQVLRYIRLTYLIPELLSMVDDGKIAFNPAVELSYLDSYQQRAVLDAMALNDCTPSHAQSIRLKKLAQEGVLDDQIVYAVLAETKPNQQEQLKFKREELRKYFPSGYTEEQMRRDIIKGLELQLVRERNGKVVNSVVHTQTRDSENERQRIDQIALLDIALRFNPDIICVGEMRGPEANAAQEAARVGIAVLTTIHSNSSEGTYRRMVSLCKRAVDTPDDTLMGYVTEAYPIVVYCRQLENKERRITNISECEILPDGTRKLHKLYEYEITENRLEGDRFIIEGQHRKCEEMSGSLQRRFIENGMPRSELEAFLQRKEVTA